MKQHLFLVLIFVLLAVTVVAVEFQLRSSQIESRAADMADTLYSAAHISNSHARHPLQKTPATGPDS